MPGGLNLTSAVLGSIDLRELTSFRAAPPTWRWPATSSGEALAFVLRREGASRSDAQRNAGSGAVRWSARPGPAGAAGLLGRRQGPVLRGQAADGSRRLEVFWPRRRLAPAWTGDGNLAVVSRRDPAATQIAVDTGSGCDDRRADLSGLDGGRAGRCCRRRPGPTGAVGWVNTRQVLVVEGGCDGPFDLWLGRERRRAEAGGLRDRPGGAALARPSPRPGPLDLAALGRQRG